MARNISETAAVIIGSLGKMQRVIACKLGHRVGRIVTVEATIALKWFDPKSTMKMEVIVGERNKEIDGRDDALISDKKKHSDSGERGR